MFGQPYSGWVAQGTEFKARAKQQGITLVGVHATPEEFVTWCTDNDMATDSKARAAFAGYKLANQLEESE
jgi:hypothetical protein